MLAMECQIKTGPLSIISSTKATRLVMNALKEEYFKALKATGLCLQRSSNRRLHSSCLLTLVMYHLLRKITQNQEKLRNIDPIFRDWATVCVAWEKAL